jgi:RNA recognition motif-containing protein
MNIYVGNLSFDATEEDVEHAFSQYGDVKTVNIVKDRDTGRSRGFGFVEMHDRQAGQEAIEGLNLKQIAGRAVTVNEARPREDRRGGGGGGGGRRW